MFRPFHSFGIFPSCPLACLSLLSCLTLPFPKQELSSSPLTSSLNYHMNIATQANTTLPVAWRANGSVALTLVSTQGITDDRCIGSGWGPFSHSSPQNAMQCPGTWKGADNPPMFWLLLSSAGTASALSLTFLLPPLRGWEWTRPWEGTQLEQVTHINQRDIPYHMTVAQI